MSFVTCVYVPDGIVIASDSRQTIDLNMKLHNGVEKHINTVSSDSINKTFLISKNIGVTHCGDTLLGGVTTESHIKKFQEEMIKGKESVYDIAQKLKEYFKEQFPEARTTFYVAGFEKEGRTSIPHVYDVSISGEGRPNRVNYDFNANKVIYGCAWGGEGDIMAKILKPAQLAEGQTAIEFPIIYDALSLQDAVDFAEYLIRTTIDTMRFQARPKSVGGSIDVLLITPQNCEWIKQKSLVL